MVDPEGWDPEHDRVFILGEGEDFKPRLNGRDTPHPIELRANVSYRFRLMNVTMAGPRTQFSILRSGAPVPWRAIAKDGHDLPAWQRDVRPARTVVTIGETRDYAVRFDRPGEVTLEVRGTSPRTGEVLILQPITVNP